MPYPTSNLDYGDGVSPDRDGDGIPDALQAELESQYARVVEHGAVASTARPTTTGVVLWIGSVTPTNAESTDIVVKPNIATTRFAVSARTAGDVAFTSSTLAEVATDLRVTVDAEVGDVILLGVNGRWKAGEATIGALAAYSVNRSALIGFDPNGIPGWTGTASIDNPIGAPLYYTVVADDLLSGQVTFALYGGCLSGTRTIKAVFDTRLRFSAQVI